MFVICYSLSMSYKRRLNREVCMKDISRKTSKNWKERLEYNEERLYDLYCKKYENMSDEDWSLRKDLEDENIRYFYYKDNRNDLDCNLYIK